MGPIEFLIFSLVLYVFSFGVIFVFDFFMFLVLPKALKFKKSDYLTALFISLAGFVSSIIGQMLLDALSRFIDYLFIYVIFQGLAFIICLLLIKYFYREDWKKTLTLGIIVFAVGLLVGLLLSFLLDILLRRMFGIS